MADEDPRPSRAVRDEVASLPVPRDQVDPFAVALGLAHHMGLGGAEVAKIVEMSRYVEQGLLAGVIGGYLDLPGLDGETVARSALRSWVLTSAQVHRDSVTLTRALYGDGVTGVRALCAEVILRARLRVALRRVADLEYELAELRPIAMAAIDSRGDPLAGGMDGPARGTIEDEEG